MLLKIIKNFLPISLLLMSCVNNQVSDIQKSANYSLDDYQITIKSTKEFCLNSDLTQEKNNSLVLILTECITNPNSNQLIRRPISSIITVRFQQESVLNSYSKISDLIKNMDSTQLDSYNPTLHDHEMLAHLTYNLCERNDSEEVDFLIKTLNEKRNNETSDQDTFKDLEMEVVQGAIN